MRPHGGRCALAFMFRAGLPDIYRKSGKLKKSQKVTTINSKLTSFLKTCPTGAATPTGAVLVFPMEKTSEFKAVP